MEAVQRFATSADGTVVPVRKHTGRQLGQAAMRQLLG